MASLAPFSITLGGTDYPAKYAALLAYIEPYLTNLETFSFSLGNVLLGTATNPNGVLLRLNATNAGNTGRAIQTVTDTISTVSAILFSNPNGTAGSVTVAASSTAYNTTSDYRLKTRIGPIVGHGERIDALAPLEFDWNADGKRARGFFAHEFQWVYPDSVTGTKDGVDEEGGPAYQAMQAATSEVMADVIAELQSLRTRVAALEAA
jgi:hypothetical protein